MNQPTETVDETALSLMRDGESPIAGIAIVFSSGEPLLAPISAIDRDIVLGRSQFENLELRDSCMSRNHARLSYKEGTWTIKDEGSRNGTYLNGERFTGTRQVSEDAVLRTGETVSLLLSDIRPFLEHHVDIQEDYIVGPRMQPFLAQVTRAATSGVLHVTGETGSGKEIAARQFHRLGPGHRGPFVAVNCAAIPEGVAERLLFGTKRGAYSGADTDARGYIQEASGGTLFLDEVGELDASVQAKLLRVLEAREVLPLGASQPVRVEIRLCSATHRDLRRAVASGKFREDLFYRLGRPHVALPPLRERAEEIPFLVDRLFNSTDENLVAHATLVEACLLRPWPGNVRELLAELRDAALEAQADDKKVVRANHLAKDAGEKYEDESSQAAPSSRASQLPAREEIESALQGSDGKVATAARSLGVHRNQLRRWLEKNNVDPKAFAPEES